MVHALLSQVEEWARQEGMTRIIGPYGFSDQDPEGFLIEGFENRATIATYYNFEWMPSLVEEEGYTKDVDYFVYKLEVPEEFPEFYKKIYERIKRRGKFEIVELERRKVSQVGLGLTFCKMVVEAHGGHIFVEPNEPVGSVFIVEILQGN